MQCSKGFRKIVLDSVHPYLVYVFKAGVTKEPRNPVFIARDALLRLSTGRMGNKKHGLWWVHVLCPDSARTCLGTTCRIQRFRLWTDFHVLVPTTGSLRQGEACRRLNFVGGMARSQLGNILDQMGAKHSNMSLGCSGSLAALLVALTPPSQQNWVCHGQRGSQ